jgi:hypothetical protein
MRHAMAATASRRNVLSRFLTALAIAPAMGSAMTGHVDASKKGKNTIASVGDRIKNISEYCSDLGGTPTTTTTPFGYKSTKCNGGDMDGTRCTHTKKKTNCHCSHTGQDGWCSAAVTAPPAGGADGGSSGGRGGISVPPPIEINQ